MVILIPSRRRNKQNSEVPTRAFKTLEIEKKSDDETIQEEDVPVSARQPES